jgi:selenocysteine lyase/cysteine desulfurase
MAAGHEVVAELARRKIVTSARGQGLRISVHIFNNFADLDRCVDALTELRSVRK